MEPLAEDELRAYAGVNANYYAARWANARTPRRSFATADSPLATGFNWAAFFLSVLWLAYRKLWGVAAVLGVVLLGCWVGLPVLYVGFLGREDAPALARFVPAAVSLICGATGNRWVLARAARVTAAARATGSPPEVRLREIAQRGGTSIAAAVVVLAAMFLAALIGGLVILAREGAV